jgi:arabinofuranan 3-O-arabinosyltransferase
MELVLAERADPRWRAELNGQRLKPIGGDSWRQVFELPAGATGTVKIWYQIAWPLPTLQVLVVVVAFVLALPLRRPVFDQEDAP